MQLSDKTYDLLRSISQYILPALGTLYFLLAGIWGLPNADKIIGTITAIDMSIGILLGYSSANYEGDGTMVVDTSNPEKDIYRMEVDDIEGLANKSQVTFKVKNDE